MTQQHKTKDGRMIRIDQMTDGHLLNTVRMIERKAKEGITLLPHNWRRVPHEDDTWYAFDETILGDEALAEMNHQAYVDELVRRGLR